MTDRYEEEREAIIASLARYMHPSMAREMPLLAAVQALVADWERVSADRERMLDILVHALDPSGSEPHPAEEPKDIATMVVDELRRARPRIAVMNKRIEDDPEWQRYREAYEHATERVFGYKIRFGHRAEAHKRLVKEAKLVQLGITAARAAGFPLGELEECVLGVLEAEKKEI